MDINNIKFNNEGLVPAIAQDARTNEVLMQAYMNKESLELTISTGIVHYFSRSRNKLWKKGEESGNLQYVKEIFTDCDGDSVLIKIEQANGVACHTGARSCFFNQVAKFSHVPNAEIIYENINTIRNRKITVDEGSYTNYLLTKGVDKICKKIGEEAAEVIIASKNNDKPEICAEMADLLYHMLVLSEALGVNIEEVFAVLEERRSNSRKRDYK